MVVAYFGVGGEAVDDMPRASFECMKQIGKIGENNEWYQAFYSSMGLWSVAASSSAGEVDRRRGDLPICLIKVSDLGFLLCGDGDLLEAGPS
jgi:hypothetical protein